MKDTTKLWKVNVYTLGGGPDDTFNMPSENQPTKQEVLTYRGYGGPVYHYDIEIAESLAKDQFKVGDIVKVKASSPVSSTLRKVLSIDHENQQFVGKPMFGTNGHYVENGSAAVVNQFKKVREIVVVS